jgi:coenzyme F420-reducing hydrogenase delta subunit
MTEMNHEIVVFTCNWNGWSCIEAAINSGFKYPISIKVLKVSCLSRVHAGLMLQSLDLGADGIMLLGCEPGKCHFGSNSCNINLEYEKAQNILNLLGIPKDRLTLRQLPAFDGESFIKHVTKFIEDIKKTTVTTEKQKVDTVLTSRF